jgi:hypothetical protein
MLEIFSRLEFSNSVSEGTTDLFACRDRGCGYFVRPLESVAKRFAGRCRKRGKTDSADVLQIHKMDNTCRKSIRQRIARSPTERPLRLGTLSLALFHLAEKVLLTKHHAPSPKYEVLFLHFHAFPKRDVTFDLISTLVLSPGRTTQHLCSLHR